MNVISTYSLFVLHGLYINDVMAESGMRVNFIGKHFKQI